MTFPEFPAVLRVAPLLLLVGYDMLRRRLYEKANKQDTDQLLAELEELRRLKAEKENSEQNV